MPALPSSSSSRAHQDSGPEDQGARGVATATAGPTPSKAEVSGAESAGGGVPSSPPPTPRQRAKTVPGPSLPSGAGPSPQGAASALPPRPRTDPPTSPRLARAAGRALTSPKLPRGRRKLGTIGVLCQQSMSFDLGVSLQASLLEAQSKQQQRASSSRPSSTSSEPGASSPTSPQAPAPPSGQGGRTRGRLLDSSWLQKPKKFFKVSK